MEKLIIGAVLVIVLSIGAVFGVKSHDAGVYNEGHAAAVSERSALDAAKLLKDTAKAADDERAARDKRDAEATKRSMENADYEKRIANALARANRGDSGMYAPGNCSGVSKSATAENSATVSGPADAEGFKLMPETAASVLDASADSARDVRHYNALMAEYERMRAVCNAD